MTCPFCGTIPNQPYPFEPQTTCHHNISFVRDIPVEAVYEAADNLLIKNKIQKKENIFLSKIKS